MLPPVLDAPDAALPTTFAAERDDVITLLDTATLSLERARRRVAVLDSYIARHVSSTVCTTRRGYLLPQDIESLKHFGITPDDEEWHQQIRLLHDVCKLTLAAVTLN